MGVVDGGASGPRPSLLSPAGGHLASAQRTFYRHSSATYPSFSARGRNAMAKPEGYREDEAAGAWTAPGTTGVAVPFLSTSISWTKPDTNRVPLSYDRAVLRTLTRCCLGMALGLA